MKYLTFSSLMNIRKSFNLLLIRKDLHNISFVQIYALISYSHQEKGFEVHLRIITSTNSSMHESVNSFNIIKQ